MSTTVESSVPDNRPDIDIYSARDSAPVQSNEAPAGATAEELADIEFATVLEEAGIDRQASTETNRVITKKELQKLVAHETGHQAVTEAIRPGMDMGDITRHGEAHTAHYSEVAHDPVGTREAYQAIDEREREQLSNAVAQTTLDLANLRHFSAADANYEFGSPN